MRKTANNHLPQACTGKLLFGFDAVGDTMRFQCAHQFGQVTGRNQHPSSRFVVDNFRQSEKLFLQSVSGYRIFPDNHFRFHGSRIKAQMDKTKYISFNLLISYTTGFTKRLAYPAVFAQTEWKCNEWPYLSCNRLSVRQRKTFKEV